MSYTYSIEPLISFCKKNKSKVMKFPKNKRVEEMYKLIDDNGLIFELADRSDDEIEDTRYEIADILEVKYSIHQKCDTEHCLKFHSSTGDIPF